MRILPFPILPKRFGTSKVPFDSLWVFGNLVEATSRNADEVLRDLETSATGLSEEEAERRLEQYGIGPCSSIFDYTTFLIMLFVFKCWLPADAALFQTGWFVESLLTQTLIIHIIRTNRIPFIQSRASWPLIITTAAIMMVGVWLPFSPIAGALGFRALPGLYWPLLILTLMCYVVVTQTVKVWLLRKAWI
jgi:hypothetical protein